MAEYYTSGIGSRGKRSRKRGDQRRMSVLILDIFVVVVMLVLMFSSLTAVICQYINPAKSGVLSVIALAAPIIYLLDVVVMMYWIVRWRWWRVVAMLSIVVLGLAYMPRYYKLDWERKYDTKSIERNFKKVVTYNVREGRVPGIADSLLLYRPDIICLQEVVTSSDNWNKLAEQFRTTKSDKIDGPLQILSRYRIIRSGLVEPLDKQSAVWADLRIDRDTVRVVNIHLQSTAIRAEDTKFLEHHQYIYDSARNDKLRSIVARLVENNRKRAEQAECLSSFLSKSPYPTILCGDFNDVPLSYTYHCISRGMDDTFVKMADGYTYTYNTLYGLLRIDNIFVSPEIDVVSYEVDHELEFSDHYPVIARVRLNSKK